MLEDNDDRKGFSPSNDKRKKTMCPIKCAEYIIRNLIYFVMCSVHNCLVIMKVMFAMSKQPRLTVGTILKNVLFITVTGNRSKLM